MRTLSYVVVTLFIANMIATIAFAQPNITVSSLNLDVEETGIIEVSFVNNGDVVLIGFDLPFNPSIVSVDLNGITISDALDDAGFSIVKSLINNDSTLRLGLNSPVPPVLVPSGVVFRIPFTGIADGTTDLDIMPQGGSIFLGVGGITVPPDVVTDGSIMVSGDPPPPDSVNVTITKMSDTTRIDPGIPVTIIYNIILNSNGEETAEDVGVTDALPDGAVFDAGMSSLECDMLIGPPNSVGCDVGDIPAGEGRELNIAISITGIENNDILNQAIVDFLDAVGERVENTSNTFTIKVGGEDNGGGNSSCSLASHTSTLNSAANILLLLMPAVVIGFVRFRKKYKNVK